MSEEGNQDRLHTKDRPLWMDDLTLKEKDLVAQIRRMEALYGEDKVQLLLFLGDDVLATIAQNIVITGESVRNLPYAGELYYVVCKIPVGDDETTLHHKMEMYQTLVDTVDQAFGFTDEISDGDDEGFVGGM